ncbi:MAG: benzoyl-CoA-dihydrodiol lyase [Alphaproteobacteria bacterium]|nr:benzoyl-CoA-dihydrodiol lyase [Alphaproteobacteria bacterium]
MDAIEFQTEPGRYRHWRLGVAGRVATLTLDVAEDGGLRPGYSLKLNSYDLGVDIELYDATQRLRFEHPEVAAVILVSAKDRVFSAGANIPMLAQSSHAEKVNFCKFTNETRLGLEDASAHSGQQWIAAIRGIAAGGGYELALAADWIILADDGASAVALPEVPLLAVLPGTGGLTRLVDKRQVRRDRADAFCTLAEGVRGRRALDWRLVDELVPASRLLAAAAGRAAAFALRSARPAASAGIALTPLERQVGADRRDYDHLRVTLDRAQGVAIFLITGPDALPADAAAARRQGAGFWPLALARALDDAILHLRANEPEIGTWLLTTAGEAERVLGCDSLLLGATGDWFMGEVRHFWKRVLKRLDVSARSLIALIEPGSCCAGSLLELALAADRVYMLAGARAGDNRPPATVTLGAMNFGPLPAANGLARLATRLLGEPETLARAQAAAGGALPAEAATRLGIATFAPDEIDWDDEVRVALQERASFSPDALSGMEANLRFAGPETLETKIFGRLSAWQNWIFQRPNAVGEAGALKRYGTGARAGFDRRRV